MLHLPRDNFKRAKFLLNAIFLNNIVFPQVIAAFYATFVAIGLSGNLLVIVTIVLESRFHVMRYVLLASLAVPDFLFLIFCTSFRAASIAQERWLYGETWCHLSPFFGRYFYINTVLHLVAVSYERYHAIIRSPLTYQGRITKCRVVFTVLIWIIPIPLSITPFLGFGKYVYNPDVFYCEQGLWSFQSASAGLKSVMVFAIMFVVPLLVLAFLNWSVYKTAKTQINALNAQMGSLADSAERQEQEMARKKGERKAAIDVSMIIAAFVLCFLPSWISGSFRRFVASIKVLAEAVLVTHGIVIISSLCNPVIYSIRKRDFRTGVRHVLRRLGLCGNDNTAVFGVNNLGAQAFTLWPAEGDLPPNIGVELAEH